MSQLKMTATAWQTLRSHGEQTYPHECCGVLVGLLGSESCEVHAALPALNSSTDSTHNHYRIDPVELVRIDRQARHAGLGIVGFYHSHPDHPAEWSVTDLDEAHWLGCCYLITTVANGKASDTNAFVLGGNSEEDKYFLPVDIHVAGE